MTDNVWQESEISLNMPEGEVEDTNTKIDDRSSLLPGESGGANDSESNNTASGSGILSFDFYQSLFDVDTDTVCNRLRSALIPKKNYNFIESVLRSRRRSGPDMYGPFWICTTLVFSTAICGNLANFIAQDGDPKYEYSPEFEKVSLVASSVFGYAYFVPVMLWFLIKYNFANNSANYRFMEILCTYGYSLFVYIPISILWVFPVESFRWLLVITGAGISGSMLAQAFYPVVKSEKKQMIYLLLGIIISLNLAMAVGFKTYFFEAKIHQIAEISHSDANIQNFAESQIQNIENPDNAQQGNSEINSEYANIIDNSQNQDNIQARSIDAFENDNNNNKLDQFGNNIVANTPLVNGLAESNSMERHGEENTGVNSDLEVSENLNGNQALVPEGENVVNGRDYDSNDTGYQVRQENVQVESESDVSENQPENLNNSNLENFVPQNPTDNDVDLTNEEQEQEVLDQGQEQEHQQEQVQAQETEQNSENVAQTNLLQPEISDSAKNNAQNALWEAYYKDHPEERPSNVHQDATLVQQQQQPIAMPQQPAIAASQPVNQFGAIPQNMIPNPASPVQFAPRPSSAQQMPVQNFVDPSLALNQPQNGYAHPAVPSQSQYQAQAYQGQVQGYQQQGGYQQQQMGYVQPGQQVYGQQQMQQPQQQQQAW